MRNIPVKFIEVFSERSFTTNATGAYILIRVLEDELKDVGPYIDGLIAYTVLRDKSANFEYKIVGEWSNDGETWTAFGADIIGPTAINGQVVSANYTTALDFGRHIRIMVAVKPTTGTTIENGVLSLSIGLQLKS